MTKTMIVILLVAPALFAADQTGRFDARTTYEPPAAHAPANVSRMVAKSVARTSGTASVDIPAAGGSGMILWTISAGRPVAARVTTPSGSILRPEDRGSLERGLRRFVIDPAEGAELGLPRGAQEVVHVSRTVAATYRVDLDLPEDVAGVTVVAAEPDSALTLATWAAPLSRQPGQPVTLHAELRDGSTPIAGANVSARLASPTGEAYGAIRLVDQGNGVYGATLPELPSDAAGAWQVRFEAEGNTANGTLFARTSLGELVAERGAARLDSIRTEVAGDVLRVLASADVRIAGSYRLDVIAAGAGNPDGTRESLAWAEGTRQLDRGATTLTIDIPLSHLGDADPETLFLDVRLLGLDPIGVAGRITLEN